MSCTQENIHVNDSKMIRQAAHRARSGRVSGGGGGWGGGWARAACCKRAAQRDRGGASCRQATMHRRHTLQGSCIKLKTRADCILSPFMYRCIWGMKVLDKGCGPHKETGGHELR